MGDKCENYYRSNPTRRDTKITKEEQYMAQVYCSMVCRDVESCTIKWTECPKVLESIAMCDLMCK